MSKKSQRISQAEQSRINKRRELMNKAKDVCEQLGVSSYTRYGDVLYKKVLENANSTDIPSLVRMFKDDPLVAPARLENIPEDDPVLERIFEQYLGDREPPRKRPTDQSMWDAAKENMTPAPSKGLKFGSSLPRATPAPVVEVVAPVVVPASKADEPEQRNQFTEFNPVPASSGFIVAGQRKAKPAKSIEGLPEVIRTRIPGGLIPDFRQFVFEKLGDGLTADELADRFLTERGLMPSVTEQASISVPDVKPATVEEVKPTWTKPVADHVDVTDYTAIATNEEVRTQSQRNAVAQKAFRDAVMANCHGSCLVSGKSYQRAIQACHIQPHAKGGKMQVCNGLVLETSLHDVFDAGDMAIHPMTLRVYFSRAALDGGFAQYHGKVIGETTIALGTAELVARWESFKAMHGEHAEF